MKRALAATAVGVLIAADVLIADRAPSKRTRLLIGPFETEVGGAFEPVTRGGYRYAPNNCC